MSPRTEQQYKEIRQEKKELIMQTALELFAMNGYDNTSISQIAKTAEISKGLLYNYFDSKEELLQAILNHGIDELMEIFDPNKDGVLEAAELEFFIKEMFKLLSSHRNFWKLYYQMSFQPEVFKHVEKKIEQIYKPLIIMCQRYFKNMGFENPEMETTLFGMLMDGVAIDYVMKPELFNVEKIQNELIRRYCRKKSKNK